MMTTNLHLGNLRDIPCSVVYCGNFEVTHFRVTPLDIESGLCLLFSSVLAVDETRCLKLVRSHFWVK